MVTTKKMLVAYDPENPELRSSDFLVPDLTNGQIILRGTKSGKIRQFGMVVFVGRNLKPVDLLEKIPKDSDIRESRSAKLDSFINEYLEQIKESKIGEVLEIENWDIDAMSIKMRKSGVKRDVKSRLP